MEPISVICITHEKGGMLARCIRQIVGQFTHADDEAIIIDDGGADLLIGRMLEKEDPRVRYIMTYHDGYRLALMCNIGIELAKNERIIKIDADVSPQPLFIRNYREAFRDRVVLYGRIEKVGENGLIAGDHRFLYPDGEVSGRVGHPLFGGNLGFMRSDAVAAGGFDEAKFVGMWGAEDGDFALRCKYRGMTVEPLFGAFVYHDYHKSNPLKHRAQLAREILRENNAAYTSGNLPPPMKMPYLHIFMGHVGYRPYEETMAKTLESFSQNRPSLRHKLWVLLQCMEIDEVEEVAKYLEINDINYDLAMEGKPMGAGKRKAHVQKNLPKGDWLGALDDDMTIPPRTYEQLYALLRSNPARWGTAVMYSPNLLLSVVRNNAEGGLMAFKVKKQVPFTEVDLTGYGCSLTRPGTPLKWDEDFSLGGSDYDWAMQHRAAGLQTVVYTEREAGHKACYPDVYRTMRFDEAELQRNFDRLEAKWGLRIHR